MRTLYSHTTKELNWIEFISYDFNGLVTVEADTGFIRLPLAEVIKLRDNLTAHIDAQTKEK